MTDTQQNNNPVGDLKYYLNLPQIQQRTDEWLKARKRSITATDIATILECNEYRTKFELFLKKRNPHDEPLSTEATEWGQTFEDVARKLCEDRYNCQIHELGLKFHRAVSWLGASPDGITELTPALKDFTITNAETIIRKQNLTIPNLLLVEFKCPIWRKITRQIPFGYWIQMQLQMEVWGLDLCLYSEHKFVKFDSAEDYDKDNSRYKGIVEDTETGELIYWKVQEYWDQVVFRDTDWLQSIYSLLEEFYNTMMKPESVEGESQQSSDIPNAKRQRTGGTTYSLTQQPQLRSNAPCQSVTFKDINWSEYHHTQEITNFLLEDPILDWFNMYGKDWNSPLVERDPEIPFSFPRYVLERYLEFRGHVLNHLKFNFSNNFIDIANDPLLPNQETLHYQLLIKYQNRSTRNINRTIEAIQSGIPIIANGLVFHPEKKTYGRIDLLVRSDWMEKVFNKPVLKQDSWYPLTDKLEEVRPDVFLVQNQDALVRQIRQNQQRRGEKTTTPTNTTGKKRKRKLVLESDSETEEIAAGPAGPAESTKTTEKPSYVMVQIKYSTLNLAANGVSLLNNPKQKIYKGHSTLLNEALGHILGQTPKQSFVLGRKSSFKTKGVTYQTDSFLDSLGIIDYTDRDKDYLKYYNGALEWISRLRKDGAEWKEWGFIENADAVEDGAEERESNKGQLLTKLLAPPPVPDLYPNMKNDRDYPWNGTKRKISENLGELTMLLNLGVKKRKELHNKGIYRWTDLTPEIMKEHKVRQVDVLETMINSNKDNKPTNLRDVSHPVIDKLPLIEFYIDFETVSDLQDNFAFLPRTNGCGMIYMVGCYVKNNVTGKSHYLNYLVDRLHPLCERDMVRDWIQDMIELVNGAVKEYKSKLEELQEQESQTQPRKRQKTTKSRKTAGAKGARAVKQKTKEVKERNSEFTYPKLHLFHWSQAEHHHLTKALENHGADMLVNYDLDLIDLYALFKEARVGLPGTFSYGLKNTAKAMQKLGMIRTIWPDDLDGNQAMVAAWRAEEIADQHNKSLSEIDFMEPIIRYNFIDCKVLEEIVHYLRTLNNK